MQVCFHKIGARLLGKLTECIVHTNIFLQFSFRIEISQHFDTVFLVRSKLTQRAQCAKLGGYYAKASSSDWFLIICK